MAGKCFNKLHQRYSDARSKWSTDTIIGEIFTLTDSSLKNQYKINSYMHELKSRGADAIYEYYVKYVKRVMDEEIDIKNVNLHYALNEVLKLNEAEKIWDFVNLLQDLSTDYNFKLDYQKCSQAIAETGNLTFNLYWAEIYKNYNQPNISVIINSKNAEKIVGLVNYVENLSVIDLKNCIEIVKASKNKEAKKELKAILKDKNISITN